MKKKEEQLKLGIEFFTYKKNERITSHFLYNN